MKGKHTNDTVSKQRTYCVSVRFSAHSGEHIMSYALGSHLVAFRLGYTHHGIYIGRGLVVHYLRDEGITIATLEDFADGQTVRVRPIPARATPAKNVSAALCPVWARTTTA